MPNPEPQQTIVSHPTVGLHPHISDGSSGVLIDYGSFTVNQNGIEYTFDENDGINQYDSFYVYVWHMDVHPDGFAWIRFYYGDNDYDEFRHKGNGNRQFWLKNEGIWSPWLGIGDATGYLNRMGIYREYIFRGIRAAGTSTWEFVNREPGLTKIVFMDQAGWGGMRGIFILNYENLETPPEGGEGGGGGGGGDGGGNGTPILENPYYLNEYVYRQSTLGLDGGQVDQSNKIPAWSNAVQNTKTMVRNTANSFDPSDYFTYFYDGYISFPVNTRKYFGINSDDDSFMWIVEGDRLWSTVGHSHLHPAFSLADHIEQTGDNNNVLFSIDDRWNHAFFGYFSDYRTGHFDFEANKLYTILIKITEHGGGAGLYWGISDNSLEGVGLRNDNFPEYFGTGYTRITINNPPITNSPTLQFSFYDNGPPFDFDFSSRFSDPDGDNLTYSIEYTSIYFTATIQDPNIAKIHIIPNNLQLMETVNSETIALTATDTFGNVSEQDFITITVRAFNDPPIYIGADILSYSEDSQDVYLDLNTIFIDPEVTPEARPSYPLSFQVAPHDVGIINTQLNSDTLKLNFLDNKNGDTQLSITATDVGNKSTTANIIVRVNPVNDKPYAIPSQYPFDHHVLTETASEVHININEPEDFTREYLINLEAFINDKEDARLDYSLSQSTNSQLFNGQIIEDNNTTKWLRLQFVENASGTGEIIVTATDRDTSNPLSLKVKWIVNINPANDAPVATYTTNKIVNEDSIISGQLTASDVDGDALTYSLVGSPIPGLTINANGLFSFDARDQVYQSLKKDEVLDITVNYKVTDTQGAEGINSFTITVTGTNDTPVATYTFSPLLVENTIITGQLTANEVDGDAITFTLVSPIPGLTLNANGSFTFDANHPNYQSLASGSGQNIIVNYQVTDTHGAFDTESFTITVTGTNDIPVATYKTNINVNEDSIISGQLTATDVDDGEILNYSLVNEVSGLTLNPNGSFSFDATHSDYQSLGEGAGQNITVNYQVTDSQGGEGTNSFTITVRGTNDIPVATYTAPGSVNEDAIISGQLSATDIDNGDTLTYSLVSPISGLTLNADGSFTFDASDQVYQSLQKNEILSIIVNYKVTDSQGVESETNSFTINVTGSNDTPVATYTTNRDVDEDATISGNLTATDAEGDAITYSLEKAVLGLTLYTDGRFTFNAGHEHYQSLEKDEILNIIVNYKATDSQEAFDTKSFTITIIGTNDTPVATYTTNIDVEEDSTINGQLTATDIDNRETLTYSLVRAIAGLTLYTDGSFTFNASDPNYQSLAQGSGQNIIVNYKVTDSQGAQDTEFFTIIVTGTNDKPVATYITNINVDEDSIITGHLTATDVDGDDITYSLVNEVLGLTLYADGSFTFNASDQHYQSLKKDEILDITVNYKATDSQGGEGTNSFTITVTGTNDGPVATYNTDISVDEDDNVLSGLLTATDLDDTNIVFSLTNGPIHGLTLYTDGRFTFNASNEYYQSLPLGAKQDITVNYRATDLQGAESTNSFTITITGTNDKPVATYTTTGNVNEDSTITGKLTASDIDNGETLNFSLVNPISGLTLSIDGSFSLDTSHPDYQSLPLGAKQDITVNYRVTDLQGAESTNSFTITITGTNDIPVANPQNETITVDEDYNKERKVTISNKFFDADRDDTLIYSIHNTNDVVSSATLDQDARVTITFKSNANTEQHGEAKVIVTATDNTGTSATYTINLVVNPKNDTPKIVVSIEDIEVNEDSVIPVINLNDYFGDIDNDNLYYIVNTNNSDLVVPFLNNSELTLQLVKNQHGEANITVNVADREPNDTERLFIIQNFRIKVNPVNDSVKKFGYSINTYLSFPILPGTAIIEFGDTEDDDENEEHRDYSFAIMENKPRGYLSARCMISGNNLVAKEVIYNLTAENEIWVQIQDGDFVVPYGVWTPEGEPLAIVVRRSDFENIPVATGAPLSIIPKNWIL